MKKSKFLAFAALGLLTLASCSDSNDPIVEGGEQETGEQIIVLDMQDTDVLSTKSRPLYSTSNKGAEQVTDLKLLLFKIKDDKTKTLIKAIDVPNWDQRSSDYNYGRKLSIRLTGNDRLKIGSDSGDDIANGESFTIVAVGQDEKTTAPAPFKFGSSVNIPGLDFDAVTDKDWNSIQEAGSGFKHLFTNAIKTYETPASEIFSGESNPTTIQLDGGFQADVLLKRQVAGVMGYFNRIPATVPNVSSSDAPHQVRYIRLVASARNTQLDLTVNLPQQEDDATENESSEAETVMNGFSGADNVATANAAFAATASTTDAYTVYAIDLAEWFPSAWTEGTEGNTGSWKSEAVKEGLLDVSSYWVNAIDASNANPILAGGSVFAGEFTIPFEKVVGKNTFELQLLNENAVILKSWNVKLDKASQINGDGADVYNIYRNHLYQIGKRGSSDTPTDPGTDPDKPQPLDKDQDLTIRINDQWEFIHDMEIE